MIQIVHSDALESAITNIKSNIRDKSKSTLKAEMEKLIVKAAI